MKIIDKPLIKNYTTYRLSGRLNRIIIPSNIEELKSVINGQYKIIGNGSNLIISESYKGDLIKLDEFDKLKIDGEAVTVGAGYSLPKLAYKVAENNLSGLEFACGIPATVGGAIYMNAGAYGREMKDVVRRVTVLDEYGCVRKLSLDDLKFGYRKSIFKEKNYICLEAELVLEKENKEDIILKMKEYTKKRLSSQPSGFSAGSVFRNPDGDKAGRLIEEAGLKGVHINDAVVSNKHANFIINTNNAKAEDVILLIDFIKDKVKREYGIDLECEQEILKG